MLVGVFYFFCLILNPGFNVDENHIRVFVCWYCTFHSTVMNRFNYFSFVNLCMHLSCVLVLLLVKLSSVNSQCITRTCLQHLLCHAHASNCKLQVGLWHVLCYILFEAYVDINYISSSLRHFAVTCIMIIYSILYDKDDET